MDVLTNGVLLFGITMGAGLVGWVVARLQLQGRIGRAVAQAKARQDTTHQRQMQRLRDGHADVEQHMKDISERLARREDMMRGMEVADVFALREELRHAKEEIGRLRASNGALVMPQVATPLRPSGFQDFVADPHVAAAANGRRPAGR